MPMLTNRMGEIRIKLPTVILMLAVVAGGSFAAGSAMPTSSATTSQVTVATTDLPEQVAPLEPEQELPPGHPPIDDAVGQPNDDSPIDWKAPARWQLVPNTSTMRLATYRVPRAPGDTGDAEVSVTLAGGSPDANAERWIRQFDEASQKSAKRTTRKVGSFDVIGVEVQGIYSGGMGKDGASQPGWALLGAIVSTPTMPTFFKLTGPARSVLAARGEFDALVGSLVQLPTRGM
jgi:hypothetical protein